MCKKQTSVSHSSTESEIISLDAGLRFDGIPALDLWDLIVVVLGKTIQTHDRERGNPLSAVTQVTSQCTTTNNVLKARTQHATQGGSMTKLGLLKSGKLMN